MMRDYAVSRPIMVNRRGPVAAPPEVALARGTDSEPARRAAKAPPRIEGVPNPPAHVTCNADALECWIDLSQVLFARGQLSEESARSLASACICYAHWVSLVRDIQANGFTTTTWSPTAGSKEIARPEATLFSDVDRRWLHWLVEFGLTDASRGKVAGDGKPPASDAADPLNRYNLQ